MVTVAKPEDSSSNSLALARRVSFNGAAFGLGSLASFAAIVLMGRSLGPTVAGHYFQAVAVVSIACSIATCGAEPGAIRALSRFRALGASGSLQPTIAIAVVPVVVVGLAICGLVELFAPNLARSFASGHSQHTVLVSLRVIAPVIPFWAAERVLTAASRGLGSNLATTVLDGFLQQSLRLVLAVLAATLIPSLVAFTVAWTVPTILVAALAAWWLLRLLRHLNLEPHERLWLDMASSRRLFGEFWRFTWARGVAYIFQVSALWIGILLTGWLSSSTDAGVFGSLSRFAIVGTLALQSINLVLEPELSQALAREDHAGAQDLYQIATGWAVAVGFPIFIALAVYSPMFLSVFGHGYTNGAMALTIVSGAMLWNILTGPVTAVLLMAGRSTWNLWNTVSALAVYLVAGIVLIPKFGLVGAAIAWAIVIVVENGLPLIEVYRGLDLLPFSKPTFRTVVAALLLFGSCGVLARVTGHDDVIGAAVSFCLALLVYLLYLWRCAADLRLPVWRQRKDQTRQQATVDTRRAINF